MACRKIRLLIFIFALFIFALYPNPYTLTPIYADWVFDITPPVIYTTNLPYNSFQEGTVSSFSITAGDSGFSQSGIYSFTVTRPASATIDFTNPCKCNPGNYPCNGDFCPSGYYGQTKNYRWNPTAAGSPYSLTATAIDNAGNISNFSQTYTVIQGTLPWIKTTSGDVHSNTEISAPGGP